MDSIFSLLRNPHLIKALAVEMREMWVSSNQKDYLLIDLDTNEMRVSQQALKDLRDAITDLFHAINDAQDNRTLIGQPAPEDGIVIAEVCGNCVHRCPASGYCYAPERDAEPIKVSEQQWACSLFLSAESLVDDVVFEAEMEEF